MRKGCCKHYQGTIDILCGKGVNTRDLVGGPNFGWVTRLPCRIGNKTDVVCGKYEEPTAEEVAEHEKAIKEATDRFTKALPVISKIKDENNGKDAKGVVKYPVCEGCLHWSHAAYNGHVWGACETEDCLRWME